MAELYLIRHGETEPSDDLVFHGQGDAPLSAKGRLEAERLRDALRNVGLLCVYTSPLARARDTADIISTEGSLSCHTDNAFIDMDFGDWTGLADKEVAERFPDAHASWNHRPGDARIPNGESLEDVRQRVLPRFREIARTFAGARVAIVTHAVVLRVLLCSVRGLGLDTFCSQQVDAGSVTVCAIEGGVVRITRENSTDHLK